MFSDFAISAYFGIGLAGWIYSKMSRRTGGEWTDSAVVAGGVGLVGALSIFVLLKILF